MGNTRLRLAGVLAPALALSCLLAPSQASAAAITFVPRWAHTSTLLPNGDVLVVGGIGVGFAPIAGAEGIQLLHRGQWFNVGPLPGASGTDSRYFHTATLLADGRVLIAGGSSETGFPGQTPLDDWIVIGVNGASPPTVDPVLVTGDPMDDAVYNHTATLMKNGSVLLCGGAVALNDYTSACSVYEPKGNANCSNPPGCMASSAANLLTARGLHAATLLTDGKVLFTGGAIDGAPPQFTETAEIWRPTDLNSGSVSPAHPLLEKRAYHTATQLGNGKVAIVGGINDRNKKDNFGRLDTTEIYDPVADSSVQGPTMLARTSAHSSTLDPDGQLRVWGGLGNITTTFFKLTGPAEAGSFVTGSLGQIGRLNITGGNLFLKIKTKLSVPVSGRIEDGSIFLSSPQVQYGLGLINFPYTTPPGANTASLQEGLGFIGGGSVNDFVTCDAAGCGVLDLGTRNLDAAIVNEFPAGSFYTANPFSPTIDDITLSDVSCGDPIAISFLPASDKLFSSDPQATIDNSTELTGVATIRVPAAFIGGQVLSANMDIQAGAVTHPLYNLSLTGGGITFCNLPQNIGGPDADGNGFFTVEFQTDNEEGTITAGSDTTPICDPLPNAVASCRCLAADGPQCEPGNADQSPYVATAVTGRILSGLNAELNWAPSRVNFADSAFTTDVATIQIRQMIFSDLVTLNAQDSAWSFTDQGPGLQAYGHTATLTPGGNLVVLGGLSTQSAFTPAGQFQIIPRLGAWTAGPNLGEVRANHSGTLLPDGRILLAGGTNGPNTLRSAELGDPDTETAIPTGAMHFTRDLHTATLLADGRVLVAGGFRSDASTGATSTAELYDPRAGVWYRTGSMGAQRVNHAAVLLQDGTVMVIGGFSESGNYIASTEIYDPGDETWSAGPSLIEARALHSATILQNGDVLVAGGINTNGTLATAERLSGGVWNDIVDFPLLAGAAQPRHSHRATLLYDGRVLVTGGNDGFGETDTSFLFDPTGPSWTDTKQILCGGSPCPRQLSFPRFNHTATLLPNGNVLVAGGGVSSGASLQAVETFDVASTSWQIAGAMSQARSRHATVLSKEGFLVASGGYTGGDYTPSTELIYFGGSLPDQETPSAPPSARLSSITAVDHSPFDRGEFLTVTGKRLLGRTEASGGGHSSLNSSHHGPRMTLQSLDGSGATGSQGQSNYAADLSSMIHSNPANFASAAGWAVADASMTVRIPLNASAPTAPYLIPRGWYHLRVGANAQYSDSLTVQVGPPKPTGLPDPVLLAARGIALPTTSMDWTYDTTGINFEDGYNIYSTSSGVRLGHQPGGTGTFTQGNLQPNTRCQISVAAYNLMGDGPLAQSATFHSLAATPHTLAAPLINAEDVTLTWNVNGNTTFTVFEVQQSTDHPSTNGCAPFACSVTSVVPPALNLTTNTVVISGLAQNSFYSFRVRAINGDGIPSADPLPFSNIVTIQTLLGMVGLTGAGTDTTVITWSWADVSATAYQIFSTTSTDMMAQTTGLFYDQFGVSTNTARSVRVRAINSLLVPGPLLQAPTVFSLAAVPSLLSPPFISVSSGGMVARWGPNENPLGTTYSISVTTLTTTVSTVTALSYGWGEQVPTAMLHAASVAALNGDGVRSADLVLGTTFSLPVAPTNLQTVATTLDSIAVSWAFAPNSSGTTIFQVIFSTADNVDLNFRIAVPFVAQSTATTALITGLQSGTTFGIKIQAATPIGQVSALSVKLTTGTGTGGVPAGSLAGVIDAETGGSITGTIGLGGSQRTVDLDVPPGAFGADVLIILSTFSTTAPPPPTAAPACGNGSTGIGINITVIPPLQPVVPLFLTFSYTAGDLVNQLAQPVATSEAVFQRLDSTGRCVPMPTSFDTAAQLVTVQLNHLSLFVLGQIAASNTVDTATAFPNPFMPTRGHGYVTITQTPAGARVRVFTMRGEEVYEGYANGAGIFVWPGTNRSGRPTASGIYLAVVEKNDDKKVLKLVVTR